jgi:hypothetical protein
MYTLFSKDFLPMVVPENPIPDNLALRASISISRFMGCGGLSITSLVRAFQLLLVVVKLRQAVSVQSKEAQN